ncbi:eukaryotic translation initiation factor 5 [Trichuris trichiura]|uniref:Eukaryotic translation initiation factor 5 n=1 Tax=Trichuris trichiura TaxID=36087 RepID=A0A077ZCF4_TRITR|nr:eukaryotic translation initiation factor 5 [Trichuris trichiura]
MVQSYTIEGPRCMSYCQRRLSKLAILFLTRVLATCLVILGKSRLKERKALSARYSDFHFNWSADAKLHDRQKELPYVSLKRSFERLSSNALNRISISTITVFNSALKVTTTKRLKIEQPFNINRNVDDTFYRYKMPRLLAKVEGKGNGIKTVVANMSEIAKALHRPPTYATKYFGCELGAQTQFDTKNERYIVNGEHDAQKLQELLDGFIKKFVLCQQCDNPETTLTVRGTKITLHCIACGHVTNVDPRKKGKNKKAKEPTQNVENGSVENGDEAFSPDDVENGDDWSVNPEDVEERQKELAAGMAQLTFNPDLEKPVEERLDMFYSYLLKLKTAGKLDDVKAIEAEAARLDVKDKAVLLLCRVIFNEKMMEQVKPNRTLLLRFVYQNPKAQRYLLGGIEQLIVAQKQTLMPKVAHVLKAFYDADILEEDVLLEWGERPSKKYVSKEESKEIRAKAEPFLSWLRVAEEESDSECDEVEVVQYLSNLFYSIRLFLKVVYENETDAKRSVHAAPKKNGVEENEDFDIDDI